VKRLFSLIAIYLALLPWPAMAQEPTLPGQTPGVSETPGVFRPDPRFGAVEAWLAPEDATEAGVGWERVLFRWRDLQPGGPGDWNVHVFPDGDLNRELAAGRELVGLLVATPGWAADANGLPKGLYLPYNAPDNTWGQFVYRIVSLYKGRIDRWVIWNEPDVWDSQHPGFTWPGTEADYYQLLKVAYTAAKAANPDCLIHLAAVTHYWDQQYGRPLYFVRLLDLIVQDPTAPQNNYYFDVATLHLYFHSYRVYDIIRAYQGYMRERGMDKPIWINETNAPPSEDPSDPVANPRFKVTLEEQSAFIIEASALALAAGAERVEVYKMMDYLRSTESGEPYGLLRADRSRRPAFYSFQVVTRYFAGAKSAVRKTIGDVETVTLDRGDKVTTVIWTTARSGKRKFSLPAIASQALLVHSTGQTETIAAEGGRYHLTLEPATCTNSADCLVGGLPLLLVEEGEASARPSLQAPAPSPTASRGAACCAPTAPPPTATPTPIPTPVPLPTPSPTLASSTSTPAPEPTSTSGPAPTIPAQPARPCLPGLSLGLVAILPLLPKIRNPSSLRKRVSRPAPRVQGVSLPEMRDLRETGAPLLGVFRGW
jgi:hypothetical protein